MAADEPLSFRHPTIQRLRRLLGRRVARQEAGAFVVEGPVLVAEALATGWEIELELTTPGSAPITGAPIARVTDDVLRRVASTEQPRPPLAVVRARHDASLADDGFVLVADGIADPGNLGTILRSAEAAGVDAVAVTAGTVDPTNPKVVRASAGALFHVPVVDVTLAELTGTGRRLIGTSSHRGTPLDEMDWSGEIGLVVGNEAHGLADDAPVDDWVTIPHRGRAESLNVAMAATLLCFAAMAAR